MADTFFRAAAAEQWREAAGYLDLIRFGRTRTQEDGHLREGTAVFFVNLRCCFELPL